MLQRTIATILGCLICGSLTAQTYVPTVVDRPQLQQPATQPPAANTEAVIKKYETVLGPDMANIFRAKPNDEATRFEATRTGRLAELQKEKPPKPENVQELTAFTEACQQVAGLTNVWRPTKWAGYRTACFWSQPGLQTLKSGTMSGNSDQGTAAVEVLSDVFWGLRFTVHSSVATSNDDSGTAEEIAKRRLQQLVTSGGNLSMAGTYAWFAYDSRHPENNPPSPKEATLTSLWTSYARLGTVLPMFGESDKTGASKTINSKDLNANLEVALLQTDTRIGSYNGSAIFTSFAKVSVVGGTKLFHDSIQHKNRHPFGYVQFGMGTRLSDFLYIMGSWSKYSGGLKSPGATLTVGFGK